MAGETLTAGEVGQRLGLKAGMVRRYALALEDVTGISLRLDPTRGRLYPTEVVGLLEAARAHLLAHPGETVEGALRAVSGQSEGAVTAPVRVPGTLTPADLERALGQVLAPVLTELQQQREEAAGLRREVEGLRNQLARLEVVTRAALPAPSPSLEQTRDQRPAGLLALLARLLR